VDDEYEDTQWTDAARQRLLATSATLKAAIDDHVVDLCALAGKREDTPAVFAANDALIAALRSYNEAIFDLTGTSAVPLYEDDDDDEDEDDAPLASEGTLRLSVEARFDFIVRDEDRFLTYVRERWVTEGVDEDDVEDHVGTAVGCLCELFQMDGWKTSAYAEYGLEAAGEGWNGGEIEKTLFEMTLEERAESQF